jgi:RNA polymerase sigma factor (sigma-70 family)
MTIDPQVTHWIASLKAGDANAARRLWEYYFKRLLALARRHVGDVALGGADSEDVAQSVFKSLCLGAERGKFPDVTDRDNLWATLIVMTANKSRDLIRREHALKRGGGHVLDEAALAGSNGQVGVIAELVGREPTPQFVVQMFEQCDLLLSHLTEVERLTAQLKLQGLTNREIAEEMGCGLRTVERRLEAIRRAWAEHS